MVKKKIDQRELFSKVDTVQRLDRFLIELNISKKSLALAGGVSAKTITNIFAGSSTPSAKALAGWWKNLGLNANWLLTGEGDMLRQTAYTREDGMLVGEASKAAPHLGPVAERVDGIERAAPGTPLVDMLPFVIKNLRSWYHTVSATMPDSRALEPEGPTYAQETNQPNGPPRPAGDKHTRD